MYSTGDPTISKEEKNKIFNQFYKREKMEALLERNTNSMLSYDLSRI